ncbi:SecDF P1 head subdomain-containing protein [Lacimonas salitolerans]|uniref:SecDF P1 head subdomain domain-containing protein n=1 Tax=Lacimonas salitolerans TaxID=1323750 RepID=A0ABW4EGY9_9RHOB
MKVFIVAMFTFLAFLGSARAGDMSGIANSYFVQATQFYEEYNELREAGEGKAAKRVVLLERISELLEAIIQEHPESDVAVEIVLGRVGDLDLDGVAQLFDAECHLLPILCTDMVVESDPDLQAQVERLIRGRLREYDPNTLAKVWALSEGRSAIFVPHIADEVLDLLVSTIGDLQLMRVVTRTTSPPILGGSHFTVMPSRFESRISYVLHNQAIATSFNIRDASAVFDNMGAPAIEITLDAEGSKKLGEATAHEVGWPLAIALDGEVLSAPVIQSKIASGKGIIRGQFSVSETEVIAAILRAGRLPKAITINP